MCLWPIIKFWCGHFFYILNLCVFHKKSPLCYDFFAEITKHKGGFITVFNFITNLLNIKPKDVKDFKIISLNGETQFHITLFPDEDSCPYCGGKIKGHGYADPKRINHPILTDKNSVIIFKRNRYLCTECLKTFSGKNPFTYSNFRNSYFVLDRVMKNLKNLNYTYLMIAENNNISVTQVQKFFDSFVNIPRITLPESLGIDEIHSKMAKRKNSVYLGVLVDNVNRSLLDILPSRSKLELSRYFERIPLEERKRVKYVTIDMWVPYKDVSKKYLPNCIIAVDPFHVVEHLMDGFTRIRLNILNQCEYNSDTYYLLKTWKDLIEKDVFLDNEPKYNKRFDKKLNKRDLQNMILAINENLCLGFRLKEMYLQFNKEATEDNCEKWFDTIYQSLVASGIREYDEFITTLKNWKTEILNSFKRPFDDRKLSNALSENINGQLRTYISISKGISNFTRFRKRSIFALNPKMYYSITGKLSTDKREGKLRGSYQTNNNEL